MAFKYVFSVDTLSMRISALWDWNKWKDYAARIAGDKRVWSPYYTLLHGIRATAPCDCFIITANVPHCWPSSLIQKTLNEKGRNSMKTMWDELMKGRWWKGYREFMNTGSPTMNSQESVLIERRPHLIWVEAAPAALMLGYLTVSIAF